MKKNESLSILPRYNKAIVPELSKENQERLIRLRERGILVEPPIGNQNVVVVMQYDLDPIDEKSLNPNEQTIKPPTNYAQLYEFAEDVLFNAKNNLGGVDIFVFHFIINRYSNQEKFDTADLFFDQLIRRMIELGMKPNKRTIQNSIYKLVKAEAIVKLAKNIYCVNFLLAYSGSLDNRNKSICNQFHNSALYNYNINKGSVIRE